MTQEAFRLKGKIAIVTECDTGLGQGIAVALAEAGCDVIGVNHKIPHETAEKINALGRRFMAIQADLGQQDALTSVMTQAMSVLDRIDTLVNNAGTIHRQDALDFSKEDQDDVINLNLKSVFFLSQAVAHQFLARDNGGRIINIASMLSFQGGICVPSYTASKSGVLGITRLLTNEQAAKGINVNAITPGYTATSNTQQLCADSEHNQEITNRIPTGRWGTPDDLKGPVVFLASSVSNYTHDYTLAVNGGWLAR